MASRCSNDAATTSESRSRRKHRNIFPPVRNAGEPHAVPSSTPGNAKAARRTISNETGSNVNGADCFTLLARAIVRHRDSDLVRAQIGSAAGGVVVDVGQPDSRVHGGG